MKKQNKTLVVISLFVLVLLAGVIKFTSNGDLANISAPIEIKEGSGDTPAPPQEAMGEAVKPTPLVQDQAEDQKIFGAILSDLATCFDIKLGGVEAMPLAIESIFTAVQGEFGPAVGQADRSMNWHLRNREGIERRVRIEITEADDGTVLREMKYYAVDAEGLPIPMELPPEKRINPSDEAVNLALKEGDVFFKEKTAYAVFSNGARIEFSEKNGQLSDFEFQNDDRFFRCQSLNTRDACQCIR